MSPDREGSRGGVDDDRREGRIFGDEQDVTPAPLQALDGDFVAAAAGNSNEPKVLRIAFRTAETSFDPAKINDIYSIAVTAHVFEAPYAYDYLAKPARILVLIVPTGCPSASAVSL